MGRYIKSKALMVEKAKKAKYKSYTIMAIFEFVFTKTVSIFEL